jgi:hypothetical protein
MKFKDPIILSTVFATACLGIAAAHFLPQFIKPRTTNFFSDNIDKFCIEQNTKKFCLSKENEKWIVDYDNQKIPAEQEMVQIYIDRLKQLQLKDLISQNPDKFKELGIGDVNKTILDVNGKKLEIGNITADSNGTFVRIDDKNEVVQTDIIFEKNNLANPDYWYLKNILELPKLQIRKITVTWSNNKKEFVSKNGGWENEDMVNILSHLNKKSYLPKFTADLNQSYQYEIEVENKSNLSVWIGSNKTDRTNSIYWATLDKVNYFEIDKNDFNSLTAPLN